MKVLGKKLLVGIVLVMALFFGKAIGAETDNTNSRKTGYLNAESILIAENNISSSPNETIISFSGTNSYEFGWAKVGTSKTAIINLVNEGSVTATGAINLDGINANQFQITNGGPNFSLAPGARQQITLIYKPTTSATYQNPHRAQITAIGSNSNSVTCEIKGNATYENPFLTITPSDYDYGTIQINTNSSDKVFVVKNIGDRTATGTISMVSDQFIITSVFNQTYVPGYSNNFTIAPGASMPIKVKYHPTVSERKTGQLNVWYESSYVNSAVAILSGTGTETPSGITPRISLIADSYTFPEKRIGETTQTYNFILENSGLAPATGTIALVGANANQFRINSENGSFTLNPGTSMQVEVQYTPTVSTFGISPHSAEIRATGLNCNSASATVSGTAYIGPQLSVSTTAINLGRVNVNDISNEQEVIITNTGDKIASCEMGIINPFIITSGDQYFTLNPGTSVSVRVKFNPITAGEKSGVLFIRCSYAAYASSVDVALSGTGVGVPSITVNGDCYFPETSVGTMSQEQSILVSNTGSATATGNISLIGDNTDQFIIVSGAGNFSLEPNTTLSVIVAYSPSSITDEGANHSARLYVTGTNCNSGSVILSGTSCIGPRISINPLNYEFGDVRAYNIKQQEFTISNEGDRAAGGFITIPFTASSFPEFSMVYDTLHYFLQPGEVQQINVNFKPLSFGHKSAYLKIVENISSKITTVGLTGTGNAAKLSFSPETYVFPDTSIGSTTASVNFTLSNSGNVTSVGSVELNEQIPSQYIIISGGGSYSLAPSSSKQISVVFAPTEHGTKYASLTALDNDRQSGSASLRGNINDIPKLIVDRSSYEFQNVQCGNRSIEYAFTVKNIGKQTARGIVNLIGNNADQFQIISNGGIFSIEPGSYTIISVVFCPTSEGVLTASLNIKGEGQCNELFVNLMGEGITVPPSPLISLKSNSIKIEQTNDYGTGNLTNDGYAPDEVINNWHLRAIHAYEAWRYGKGNPAIPIAIIDDGIDINHPDLKNVIWVNKKETPNNGIDDDRNGYIDDINGWDLRNHSNNVFPDPSIFHGTCVAGAAAAETNNGIGIASVSNGCTIMPIIGIGNDAIRYAVDNGARIISISVEGNFDMASVKYAYDRNVVVVFASGNSNQDLSSSLVDSWNCDESILVAATMANSIGDRATKWNYSNYGKNIDVSAPGASIYTTNPINLPGDGYKLVEGTSIAAPIVAGLAGLIISQCSTLTAKDVIYIIKESTRNIDCYNPNYVGKLGTGIIDAHKALKLLTEAITIENNGSMDLIVDNIISDKTWLSISNADIPIIIAPKTSKTIFTKVDWSKCPLNYEHIATVYIHSNDPNQGTLSIPVAIKPDLGSKIIAAIPDSIHVSEANVESTIQIQNNGTGIASWNADCGATDWIKIISSNKGEGNGIIKLKINSNTGDERIGRITLNVEGNNPIELEVKQDPGMSYTEKKLITDFSATQFGNSVAIYDNSVLIGNTSEGTNTNLSGYVYRYEKISENWQLFNTQYRFASNIGTRRNFGHSVDMDQSCAIVGAFHTPSSDELDFSQTQAAYIFKKDEVGKCIEHTKFSTDCNYSSNLLGSSVAISGNYAVAGAIGYSASGIAPKGCVYVFENKNNNWERIQIVSDSTATEQFGSSVSINGNYFVVGDKGAKAAFLFKIVDSICCYLAKLTPGTNIIDSEFGKSVSIFEDKVAVGDPKASNSAGAVFIYQKPSNIEWVDQTEKTILRSNSSIKSQFGSSIDMFEDYLAIGAPEDDENGLSSGAVYIFRLDSDEWYYYIKLNSNNDESLANKIGASVALFNNTVVAGAPNNNNQCRYGIAYIYELSSTPQLGKSSRKSSDIIDLPTLYELGNNFPNPFNPTTMITYHIPTVGKVQLKIYDLLGRELTTLVDEIKNSGRYSVEFNAEGLSSGIYIYQLSVNGFRTSKKMLLMK